MKRAATIASMLLVMAASPLFAGQRENDPLTERQTEELRDYAQEPVERIKLFIKYIEERTQEIHHLGADATAQNRSSEIRNRYQEFTAIADELQDNMDSYDDQHADLRKALKSLIEESEKWTATLNEPGPDAKYDFDRKVALEASQSVHDASQEMLADEAKYFAEHKEDKIEKSGGNPGPSP